MSETLLDIVQTACGELVLNVPTSVMAGLDQIATDMLFMAQQAGRELVRTYEWGNLVTLATFPTVANQATYSLPSDYFRMVNDTQWDRSTHWRTTGPLTPQADRFLRESQIADASVYRQFRLLGNSSIEIYPTPPDASGLLVYEYVSRAWVNGASGRALKFAADTDTTVFDFDLMVKECKWRWMFAKGQDAAEYRQERDDALGMLMAADQGGTVLNMAPGCWDYEEGQVIAAPEPNFILSTDSGMDIVIE